jgi:signal transduction histidine kinase
LRNTGAWGLFHMYQRRIFSYSYLRCCTFLACLVLLCLANRAYGQQPYVIRESNFGTMHEVPFLDSVWYFHPGEMPGGKHAIINTAGWDTDYLPMFAAAQLILGLLHFLFFLFYPRQKLNAYYALFVLLIGINGMAIYQFYMTPYPSVQYLADFTTTTCKVLIMWAAVLLLYVLNYRQVPRWRMAALTGITLFYLTEYVLNFWFFKVDISNDYFSVTYIICMLDGLWSAAQVIKRGQKDAWLVGIGVGTIILVYVFAWDDMFTIWPYGLNSLRLFVMGAGSLVLPLCLSLYLALDFARINQKLTAKLREVANLSALTLAQEAEKTELIATEARRLEQIVQQRTAELKEQADKLLELDVVKSRFFTNIAHELKTPLTLIMNPAKELLYAPTGDTNKNLRLIINNAERLLRLINQLTGFEQGREWPDGSKPYTDRFGDVVKLHVLSYESLALQKKITLHFTAYKNALWILADRDKMDKVVSNILSNALKFTNEGKIEIVRYTKHAEAANSTFTLTVSDTGKGIPPAKLPYFHPFLPGRSVGYTVGRRYGHWPGTYQRVG